MADRSKSALKSKRKGKLGEDQAARFLRRHGFPDAERWSHGQAGCHLVPDVEHTGMLWCEVKNLARIPALDHMRQAEREAFAASEAGQPPKVPVVLMRQDGDGPLGWTAMLNATHLMQLLKAAGYTAEQMHALKEMQRLMNEAATEAMIAANPALAELMSTSQAGPRWKIRD